MNILFIGDIFSAPGRLMVSETLPKLYDKYDLNFVIANGENCAGGFGLNKKSLEELSQLGVDCFTLGNHTWSNGDIVGILEGGDKRVVRPLNLAPGTPGAGYREMQKVQPLMNEINEKYKNNPQKKQEEMLKVYQKYKVNPAAGCLPLLIQMPILIAIFQMLRNFEPANPDAYRFFWIPDLSSQDPTGIVLPVIVVITSLAQQYVNTTNKKDPTQKAMLITMPLMMGFFARTMPAGLGIYWAMISILGALQQIFFNEKGKKEDEKIELTEEAEKQAKKEKKAEAIARSKEEKALATQKRIAAANANAPLNAQGKKKKVVIGPDGQPLKRKIEKTPNTDNTDNKNN